MKIHTGTVVKAWSAGFLYQWIYAFYLRTQIFCWLFVFMQRVEMGSDDVYQSCCTSDRHTLKLIQ
jgi:hypothetical protein